MNEPETRAEGIDPALQAAGWGEVEQDHRHRLRSVRAYDYRDAAALVADFWAEVEALMHERGVWP